MITAGKPFGGIPYQKTIESGFFTVWLPFAATKRIREGGRENSLHSCLIVFCDRLSWHGLIRSGVDGDTAFPVYE
jgi:hypothetical protein